MDECLQDLRLSNKIFDYLQVRTGSMTSMTLWGFSEKESFRVFKTDISLNTKLLFGLELRLLVEDHSIAFEFSVRMKKNLSIPSNRNFSIDLIVLFDYFC